MKIKNKLRALLIAGGLFALAGIAAFVIGMSTIDWDFRALDNHTYVDREYIPTEDVTSLSVSLSSGHIEIRTLDATHPAPVIYYNEDADTPDTTITLTNGKLEIKQKTKWNKKQLSIANNFNFGQGKTVAYVPANLGKIDIRVNSGNADICGVTADELSVDLDSGKVELTNITATTAKISTDSGNAKINGSTFDDLTVRIKSGTVRLDSVTAPKIDIKINSGRALGNINGVRTEYNISVNIDSGRSNLSNQFGTDPAKRISIEIDSGRVNIDFK